MNFVFIITFILIILITSCHPGYKRLTRGNWIKDTTWVRYNELPKPVFDTIESYYHAIFTLDTTDDINDIISLEKSNQFVDDGFYDFDSPKHRIPFGWYFKIGEKKYFIDYSECKSPFVFYENTIYYRSGIYYDENIKNKLYSSVHEKWPYDKMYYVKYKLK